MLKLKKLIKNLYKFKAIEILVYGALLVNGFRYCQYLFLPVNDITIIGNTRVTKDDINIPHVDNIFMVPVNSIYENLAQHQWVKSVTVKRILPDRLVINITEYKPFAIWDKKFVIDQDGKVITEKVEQDNLLSVLGKESNRQAYNFLQELEINIKDVKELEFVNQRRWNITLKEGLTVKLPDENTKKVWKKALAMIRKDNLLTQQISILDMRIPDKIFLR